VLGVFVYSQEPLSLDKAVLSSPDKWETVELSSENGQAFSAKPAPPPVSRSPAFPSIPSQRHAVYPSKSAGIAVIRCFFFRLRMSKYHSF
jgi:hypothetical protein